MHDTKASIDTDFDKETWRVIQEHFSLHKRWQTAIVNTGIYSETTRAAYTAYQASTKILKRRIRSELRRREAATKRTNVLSLPPLTTPEDIEDFGLPIPDSV
jgi:hypothetical protein